MTEFDTKKEFKEAALGFIGYLIIFNVIIFLKPNLPWLLIIFLIYSAIRLLILKAFSFTKLLRSFIFSAIAISIIYYLVSWFGFWGFIISLTLLLGFVLFSKRKKYIAAKHKIESMIWGRPLKDFKGKKEELPKVKFKW